MDDFVDYEEYARSHPHNETLVSIPEGGTYKRMRSLGQIWTRDPSPIRYRLSAKPPTQSNIAKQSPASTPAIAKSTDVRKLQHGRKKEANGLQNAHIAVQNNQPASSHPAPNPTAMNPNTQTQNPIPPPPSTSLPFDRNHPNAATIPGLTPGTNRCDTCFKYHVSTHPSTFPLPSLFFSQNNKLTPSSSNAAITAPTATSIPCWRLDRIIGAGRGVEYEKETKGGGGGGCYD